jgi:uncharacterized protein (DUF305 family)
VVVATPSVLEADMNNPAMLAVALGSSVAGALLAALALLVILPAAANDSMHPAHDHQAEGIPIRGRTSESPPSNFYSEMATINARMHESMAIAPRGNIDQDFIGMMIPHHQGAIDMALVLLKYGHDKRLRRVAQSIIVEQGQEITYLRTLRRPPAAGPSTIHRAAEQ